MFFLTFIFLFCACIILYTYFGYPLILALISFVYQKSSWWLKKSFLDSDAKKLPNVTLLIAAYNEERVIESKLQNSLELDYPKDRLQIIVAADGSTDKTVQIVDQFKAKGVDLSFKAGRAGKMAAINRAMQKATGEIVVFSDANNLYAKDAIRMIVIPYSLKSVGGVSGSKRIMKGDGLLGHSEGLYWKYESYIKKMETKTGNTMGAVGEIFSIRKDLFEPPPEKVINDDFYLAVRLVKRGFRVVYQPEAKSFERVSLTAEDELVRRTRIISGRYQALFMAKNLLPWKRPFDTWKLISHKYLRPIIPLAMIGLLISNLLGILSVQLTGNLSFALFNPRVDLIIFVLQLLFYFSALLGNNIGNQGILSKALYIPSFLLKSNWAALKGLIVFLSRKESALWERAERRYG